MNVKQKIVLFSLPNLYDFISSRSQRVLLVSIAILIRHERLHCFMCCGGTHCLPVLPLTLLAAAPPFFKYHKFAPPPPFANFLHTALLTRFQTAHLLDMLVFLQQEVHLHLLPPDSVVGVALLQELEDVLLGLLPW